MPGRESTGEPAQSQASDDDDAASTLVARVDGVDGIDVKITLPHGFFLLPG